MRILVANDGFGDAGGVQSYLDAVVSGLVSRGHDIAMLYRDAAPAAMSTPTLHSLARFSIEERGLDATFEAIARWQPEIGFSHNMSDLAVDRRLLSISPVVKFMHGYFGTCIGGQKMFRLPVVRPCGRTFGTPCLALYLARGCGQLSAGNLVRQYRWARQQQAMFAEYNAIVVASDHMKAEYVTNGADANTVYVNPLFPTHQAPHDEAQAERPPTVAFFARMTTLKGGDLLVRAVALASRQLGTPIHLTMVGDGPQRPAWERLAARLGVTCTFAGWQSGDERWTWLRRASLLAVPSTWPEPFGLVGLEAAALGVPAIAFDVGGVREWLISGTNGYLVPGNPPRAAAFAEGLVTAFRHGDVLKSMRSHALAVARRMTLDRHLDRLEDTLRRHAHSAPR